MAMVPPHGPQETLTEEEEELGRLLTEEYPEIASLLLAAADITQVSYDQRKNEAFLLALSDIAATVLVRRMPRAEAAAYVAGAVEQLQRELRGNLMGPQTGPFARGELPRS
jgi:acyl transferase domain-containing protein